MIILSAAIKYCHIHPYSSRLLYWHRASHMIAPVPVELLWMIWIVHHDIIKWKHYPRYWPFARGIHRSPLKSLHKGQWRGALVFPSICAWINGWANNRETGDLKRHRAHNEVTVMQHNGHNPLIFLATTKQLYEWSSSSVRLSVCLSVRHTFFHHVRIIVSSWKFQGWLPMTGVMSMQKVKVRGQRSRSQRSKPNLAFSGL